MLDFSRFRVITFDCYGTLIDWETGILAALRPVLAGHGSKLTDPEILSLYAEVELEAESSEYRAYKEVLRAVVRGFGTRLGFIPTESEQQRLPDSLAHWEPFPDTVPALERLKARFQLGIISNVDDDLFSSTARRLRVNFDYVVTAGQARAYKPSLSVFRLAQTKLGIEPNEWLHAAQSLYHDIRPASSLGISTVWVHRPSVRPSGAVKRDSSKPDVEVPSLERLADLACLDTRSQPNA
jgi:2-haloacid dehalogenase